MYDINKNVITKGRKLYVIFLLVGILLFFIIGGILVSRVKKINSMDANTMSFAVDIAQDDEGMYMPIYHYEVNGEEFKCSDGTYSSSYPSTDNKLVYYDKKSPGKCAIKSSTNLILVAVLILPIICITISIVNFRKINKRVKLVEELNQKGKLVKNLPYMLEDTGTVVNNRKIQRPVVEYTLSTGSIIKLYGDPRFDGKTSDSDGYVDIVIDESNPDNYFIDFDINRITGNKPEDYFVQTTTYGQQMYNQQQMNNPYDQQMYNQQPMNNPYGQQMYEQQPMNNPYGQQMYNQQPMNNSYNQQMYNNQSTEMPIYSQPTTNDQFNQNNQLPQ